jgi:hypothetical protein
MSEVFVHCVREDKSIQQIFSIKGPTLDEFMYHLVSNDVCPLKNYICKYVDYIKQLNIYYDNEHHFKVSLETDSQIEGHIEGFLKIEDVKENVPYLH